MSFRLPALVVVLLSTTALAKYNDVVPTLDEDEWWGPGTVSEVDNSLKPFTIEWSDELIADLRYRLKNRRPFRAPLEGVGFQDGFNVNTLNPILDYWADGYDFETRLSKLNQYDQYKTNIDGLNIHFLWVKPQVSAKTTVVPLILLHGWPSSFTEFLDTIPLLTAPRDGYDFVYELVIPSLPGFGYSDAPARHGMGPPEFAVSMHKLMQRLGYEQYYVQGGDVGSGVGNSLATLYPENVLGYHTNMPYPSGPLYQALLQAYEYRPEVLEEHVRARVYPLTVRAAFWDSESGYHHIQRTKPDTIGFGLTDSPSGLAAYTLEKYSTASNIEFRNYTDGGFSTFDIDHLIDNLMVYWDSNCITTSVRYYKELLIADLRYRLKNRRPFRAPLEGVSFQDGFNVNTLNPILDYWADGYDFETRLSKLNQYDQYKTNIDGLNIHFLWVKPQVSAKTTVVPLILLHGWPSSFREFLDAIPLLTSPRDGYDFVYELVIPSLPGFGYSDAPARHGMGPPEFAVSMHKLMQRLGYEQYYVQGGDVGSGVGNSLATLYPENVLGYHTNMPYPSGPLYQALLQAYEYRPEVLEEHVRARVYPLTVRAAFWDSESGYHHIQRTKPDTIGFGLTDSPSGLAAYTLEKYSTASNIEFRNYTDGGFSTFDIDHLIDNLMVYWDSNCITTSVRYYKELVSDRTAAYRIDSYPSTVPVWALQSYIELIVEPAVFFVDKFVNLLNVTYSGVGGHFYAMMEPELFADNLFTAVDAFRDFHASGGKKCSGITVEL